MQSLAIQLSEMETYLLGIHLPQTARAVIRPVKIPSALEFGDVSFFSLDLISRDTVLEAFPLLVFRTKEATMPSPGEVKEIRLYGLANGDHISLNSYIRGTATIEKYVDEGWDSAQIAD